MSEEQKKPATNALGLAKSEYKGGPSTMCKGCGHDRISEAVIQASYDLDIDARNILKMSGIGCSSKTPAYFLGNAMGLNSTHGRMPSFSTGAHVANTTMSPLGVSGDGDSASIGMGQFVHIIRRNPRMVYIIENNGVYGLTKDSSLPPQIAGARRKRGAFPRESSIDLCGLALELGATFIARSFSGDKKQLVPLLKAALSFDGLAFLDVISPCVTFNNHESSTKSYTHQKEMGVHLPRSPLCKSAGADRHRVRRGRTARGHSPRRFSSATEKTGERFRPDRSKCFLCRSPGDPQQGGSWKVTPISF